VGSHLVAPQYFQKGNAMMLPQAVMILGLLVNTTMVDEVNDPMITDGKIHAPEIVRVTGSISESSVESFTRAMYAAKDTGQPVIPIVVTSYGGSVYALFKMVDVINKIKEDVPVATIVIGKAMSAGAVLLSCGTEGMRYASPLSTVMIHEVSSGTRGKTGEIKADAKETDRLNNMLLEMIATNIGKPKAYFTDVIHTKGHADWYLSAEDALEHGLVNKIGIPDLKVKAIVTVTLE